MIDTCHTIKAHTQTQKHTHTWKPIIYKSYPFGIHFSRGPKEAKFVHPPTLQVVTKRFALVGSSCDTLLIKEVKDDCVHVCVWESVVPPINTGGLGREVVEEGMGKRPCTFRGVKG